MSSTQHATDLPEWRNRAHRMTRSLAFGMIAVLVVLGAGLLAGVRVVWTDSLPRGIYFVHHGALARNRIVATCLPAAIGKLAVRRGYISTGQCPGDAGELAKVVAGLPGDTVRVTLAGVEIDGHRWPWSEVSLRDSSHRPLGAKLGTYRIAQGQVLLLGLNGTSWDGRYFGPISNTLIRGVASPVLIENGAATKVLRAQYPIVGYLHL